MAMAMLAAGCGAPQARVEPLKELEFARNAYERAEAGPAAAIAPEQLRRARVALDRAEAAYRLDPRSPATRDLAYLAERRAELVEAEVGIVLAQWRIDVARRLRAKHHHEASSERNAP